MKTLSFTGILGIFVVGLIVLIAAVIGYVKMTRHAPTQTVTKQYPRREPPVPPEPAARPERQSAKDIEQARTNAIAQGVMNQLKPSIEQVHTDVAVLEQRVKQIEAERQQPALQAPVPPKATPRQAPRARTPLRSVPGLKSLAVAGHRAWVVDGDGSQQTVAAGDVLVPPAGSLRRVKEVMAPEQIVITTSGEQVADR